MAPRTRKAVGDGQHTGIWFRERRVAACECGCEFGRPARLVCAKILPLEAALTLFLRRNWRNKSDIPISCRTSMCASMRPRAKACRTIRNPSSSAPRIICLSIATAETRSLRWNPPRSWKILAYRSMSRPGSQGDGARRIAPVAKGVGRTSAAHHALPRATAPSIPNIQFSSARFRGYKFCCAALALPRPKKIPGHLGL